MFFAVLVGVPGQVAETCGIGAPGAAARRAGATAKSWRALPCCALLLSGLGACFGDHHYTSRAYFANLTREPVNVRIQQLQADVDCNGVAERSAELLAKRSLFGDPVMYRVAAGAALPLELADEAFRDQQGTCAVMVQLLGFPDQLVALPLSGEVTTKSEFAEPSEPDFRQRSLRLEGHGDVVGLALGEELVVTPLPPISTGEPTIAQVPALGWSGPAELEGTFTLLRRETLPDGCASLELGAENGAVSRLFLCAPEWSFPFEVGQELSVLLDEPSARPQGYDTQAEVTRARHLMVNAGGEGPRLEIWLNASQDQVPAVGAVTLLPLPGRHLECGAYADPVSVELTALGATLQAGDEIEHPLLGRRVRALLGRGDQVVVAPDDCDESYAALGARFDLLTLNTAEVMP